MSDKCDQFEAEINRYQRLLITGFDSLTVERIEALILDLQKRKETVEH